LPPLPFTGANVVGLVEGGLALLMVGAIVLLIGRRRGHTTSDYENPSPQH
jgi:hypothetical protein